MFKRKKNDEVMELQRLLDEQRAYIEGLHSEAKGQNKLFNDRLDSNEIEMRELEKENLRLLVQIKG